MQIRRTDNEKKKQAALDRQVSVTRGVETDT